MSNGRRFSGGFLQNAADPGIRCCIGADVVPSDRRGEQAGLLHEFALQNGAPHFALRQTREEEET